MTFSEQMPIYPGGQTGIVKYISQKLAFDENDHPLTFQVTFIIDKNGRLIDARIKNKKKSELTSTEKKLLKVLMSMPRWIPGLCNKERVDTKSFLLIQI